MRIALRIGSLAALAVLMVASAGAAAQVKGFNTKIERMLTTDNDEFSGCMIRTVPKATDQGLNCGPSGWVTLDCAGNFGTRDATSRRYEAAQLAFALDRTLFIKVDDSRKVNGYCYVERLDTLPAPAP